MTFDEVDAMLEHHGVKGMKWGVRKKAIHNKFRPVGLDKKGRVQIQRRGIAGHVPIVKRTRKVSKRKMQRILNELDMNIKWSEVQRREYDRYRIGEQVVDEMTKRFYQDRQTVRDNKKKYREEKKAAKNEAKAQKKAEAEAKKNS